MWWKHASRQQIDPCWNWTLIITTITTTTKIAITLKNRYTNVTEVWRMRDKTNLVSENQYSLSFKLINPKWMHLANEFDSKYLFQFGNICKYLFNEIVLCCLAWRLTKVIESEHNVLRWAFNFHIHASYSSYIRFLKSITSSCKYLSKVLFVLLEFDRLTLYLLVEPYLRECLNHQSHICFVKYEPMHLVFNFGASGEQNCSWQFKLTV